MGGRGSSSSNISKVPQGFIDRVLENNPDADLNAVANRWLQTKAESEKHMSNAKSIKVGDTIDGNKVELGENAGISRAEGYAYWNAPRVDGGTARLDLKSVPLKVTKVEQKGSKVKITAEYELSGFASREQRERMNGRARVVHRAFNANDTLHKY